MLFGCEPGQSAGGIHGRERLGAEFRPSVQLAVVGRDDDVGHIAVDHVVGVEHHRADRSTLGQRTQRVGVGLVCGQQRQFGQRGAEQRAGHQALAEFFEDDSGITESAAGAAEFLGHHQSGSADLLAQQPPQ